MMFEQLAVAVAADEKLMILVDPLNHTPENVAVEIPPPPPPPPAARGRVLLILLRRLPSTMSTTCPILRASLSLN